MNVIILFTALTVANTIIQTVKSLCTIRCSTFTSACVNALAYGLYTYEELNAICPLSEEMFNAAGGAYLKISIAKGNLTEDELITMINRYSKFFA